MTFRVRLNQDAKAGRHLVFDFLRELVILSGRSGQLALFEIEDDSGFAVLAVRHQTEDEYH